MNWMVAFLLGAFIGCVLTLIAIAVISVNETLRNKS